ncbi:MAG TPA: ABC transporter substrate-binding protein [Terriglobales bacterium]|nr:ABC transporter substrate-binding protein [Terriglobales bacterium]
MKCFWSLILTIVFLLCAGDGYAQTKFLMGYSSFSSNQIPLWVAKDEGLFKRYGTDPDLILIEGSTRGAQALISGDIRVMGMGGQPVISARARGADLVMIAGMVNKMNYIIASAAAVKKPEDLKNKRIGAAQAGTASYHAVLLGLKHWGLDARRDRITILQLGNQGARVASLQSGGSDAIIVNPGLGSTLKARGFSILADFTELPIPYPQQTISVRERSLKSDADFIERVMRGVVAGNVFSLDPRNKERVKQITAKYLRLDSVDKAEEHYQSALKVMALKPYVDTAGIASMIEFMAESDPLVAKVKPEMVIHHSVLKKLDDSGFIEQLAKR